MSEPKRLCGRLAHGTGSGFSLLELLIALAVIVVIAAIAVPAYRGHVATARDAALVRQVTTMVVFQEDRKLRTGRYGAGVHDTANGISTLAEAIDWMPSGEGDVVYEVAANGGDSWTVTATDASGRRICRVFPGGKSCE